MGFANEVFGGLGALLGQQQAFQNQQAAWQYAVTNGTANTATNTNYVVSVAPVEEVRAVTPHRETAVEWLDRRVNEIRLPLAA